jgi:hypothetical protein
MANYDYRSYMAAEIRLSMMEELVEDKRKERS